MSSLDIIGLIGSIALGICNLPQAYHSYKNKSSYGVSPVTVIIGLIGCFSLFIYMLIKLPNEIFLILNYLVNLAALVTIFCYGFGKKDDENKRGGLT
jgi:uncharacterized protein with PQ loop repeat